MGGVVSRSDCAHSSSPYTLFVRLQVVDDTSTGQACPVRDVTLRLLKDRHWSEHELISDDDSGPDPIYDSCCDADETGLKNTLYWELDTSEEPA